MNIFTSPKFTKQYGCAIGSYSTIEDNTIQLVKYKSLYQFYFLQLAIFFPFKKKIVNTFNRLKFINIFEYTIGFNTTTVGEEVVKMIEDKTV